MTDPGHGGIATTSSTGTIDVAEPQVDISGTFKKAPTAARAGMPLSASITITNNGNVPAIGDVPIIVDASSSNTLDDAAGQVLSVRKRVNIKPGKSLTIQLSRLISPVIAGSYYLIVQLDPNNTLGDVNTQNNIFATGAPIVVG